MVSAHSSPFSSRLQPVEINCCLVTENWSIACKQSQRFLKSDLQCKCPWHPSQMNSPVTGWQGGHSGPCQWPWVIAMIPSAAFPFLKHLIPSAGHTLCQPPTVFLALRRDGRKSSWWHGNNSQLLLVFPEYSKLCEEAPASGVSIFTEQCVKSEVW